MRPSDIIVKKTGEKHSKIIVQYNLDVLETINNRRCDAHSTVSPTVTILPTKKLNGKTNY